jgi:hypothetical protein
MTTRVAVRGFRSGRLIFSMIAVAVLVLVSSAETHARPATATKDSCPALKARVDQNLSPLMIISDGPIPAPKNLQEAPTPAQLKCTEALKAAGKRAIERKRIAEGVTRYLAAVNAAPTVAETTYQDLASMLDRSAYRQPALAAYFKAWKAFEANYNRPDAQLDGIAVLVLADIRDSIVRLGGQVPPPSSEVGRIVIGNSTRHLREQYFNADPLVAPSP